ncbi:MAG: pyridoxal phosphate-dependent aminotransferase [Acidobacteria bacterium]|nr:MAG: pyridoxal phosphate-dependent aminotransferase [Acidobacteriota bacterium]PYY17954.1 MAG: pyridoxal phosphate-dependent aminotransferase [Acidobacteriota bacterium]
MATTAVSSPFSARVNRIEVSATIAMTAEAAKLRAKGIDLCDMGMGEPHFNTPRHIKDAGIAAIEQNFTKYTAVGGVPELRKAIVKRHATDFGSNYTPDEAVAATGGKQALFNAIQVLVDHGDEVIIPVPYWVSFKDIVEYAGGKCIYVEADEDQDFRLTANMIERAITSRTRAIILNSPCNPSGAVMNPDDMREVLLMAHRRGIYVIADECYVYLNFTGDTQSAGSVSEAREHLVIIGSLSKSYAMTGWRSGYALGPAPVIAQISKLQSQSTSNPASMVQKAAIAALEGPQDCIAEFRADYIRLRDQVLADLTRIPGVRCARPEGAFYVYPNISAYLGRGGLKSSIDVANRLLHEAHVVTVPGEGFGTREHIRLSYATSGAVLKEALQRMKNFFASV